GDCASGFCSTDGICCAMACSGPCQSCQGGVSCLVKPAGDKGACTGNEVCSSRGVCYCATQGFLGPPLPVGAGRHPVSVVAQDLNDDGKPDLVVVNSIDSTVSVLLGKGDGTFAPKVDYPTGAGPFSIAVADLNGDGKPDLAVANGIASTVSVLFGKGD